VRELRRGLGVGLVLVSARPDVVAQTANEVLVMKDGACVEHGPTTATFARPATEYTRALVGAVLRLDAAAPADRAQHAQPPLIQAKALGHRYHAGGWWRRRPVDAPAALQALT
jgi:peptide/nickel transport system ATP-binding protein